MRELSKAVFTLILLMFGYVNIYSQFNSDVVEVLNTAFEDNGVKFKREKSNKLESLDYSVPLLEKIELRSETNDFDIKKQDFSLRISPNNGSSRKAHRLYHESVMFMAEMEYSTEIIDVLLQKYRIVKNYIFTKELLRLEKVKNVVAIDKVKLLKKMISLSSFDIVELIEAEDAVYKLQRRIQNIKNNFDNLEQEIRQLLSKQNIDIKLDDIISVYQIKELINLDNLSSKKNHPAEEVLSAKLYNIQMEYEWEASKNNFSIGYLQAKYSHDSEKSFSNNFSLGIGFDIPIKGTARLDLNEIKVNILEAQSRFLELADQIQNNKQSSELKLLSLINMYELLSIQIEEGNADHALKEYSKQRVASPRAILKLKELTVNNEALLLEIQSDIMDTYLDYIYNTGAIGSKPYQNYFDGKLTVLN